MESRERWKIIGILRCSHPSPPSAAGSIGPVLYTVVLQILNKNAAETTSRHLHQVLFGAIHPILNNDICWVGVLTHSPEALVLF